MPTYLGNTLITNVQLGSVAIGEGVQYIIPNYVTQSATLILDAGNPLSYTSGSTQWRNLASGFNTTASIENGMQNGYSASLGGYFNFPSGSTYLTNMGGPWSTSVSFAGNFSFNMWFAINNFRPSDPTAADWVGLLAKDSIGSNPGFGIIVNRDTSLLNRGQVRFYANGLTFDFPTKPTITSGKWNNLQITRSGSIITGYWDGSSIGTGSYSGSLNDTNVNMTFGRGSYSGPTSFYKFEGNVSFLAAYSSSLSQGEIVQNYNALLPRYAS